MFLEYLDNIAQNSLDGVGIAYAIDTVTVLRYVALIFLGHFIIYLAVKRKNFNPRKYFMKMAFAFYFVIIVAFTLLPIYFPRMPEPTISYNFSLMPLLYVFVSRAHLINIAGNIILFTPISILGYVCGFKIFKSWKTTAIFMLALSLLIETIQYFELIHGFTTSAVVDIVDVITNVIGGLLGLAIIKFWLKSHHIDQ